MIPEPILMLFAVVVGTLIGSLLFSGVAKGIYQHYAEPAVARRGGAVYSVVFAVVGLWPIFTVVNKLDFDRIQFLLPIFIVASWTAIVGVLLFFIARSGWHIKLPVVGRSFNAYLLASARANLENVQKQVRRYEEIDAMFTARAKA